MASSSVVKSQVEIESVRIRSILDPSAPSADDDLLRFKMMKMWGHLSSATLGRPSPEERERKRRLREAQMQQIQLELTLDRKHLKQAKAAKQTSKSIFDLHRSKTFRNPATDHQVRYVLSSQILILFLLTTYS